MNQCDWYRNREEHGDCRGEALVVAHFPARSEWEEDVLVFACEAHQSLWFTGPKKPARRLRIYRGGGGLGEDQR